ncbi:hypothetical protein A4X13_0g8071 [Tilletia indica]|uniref:Retrotransposon gag domain-containing protein n=1 Tax=Tilletia indica TaxID=43049 RepID=A0A8T8SGP8_9BASI|nr:hypothetical protein A4X13_0g8071 [Tilletia indica]
MSSTPTPGPTTAQLQSEIQSLRAQLALAASANLDPAFRVKVSDPPEFNGRNRREAGSFVAHLKLKFAANAPSFASDASKIVYAASWLRGEAFEWFEPFLKSGSHLDMEWEDFERQFLRSQGETDLKKTLTHDLQTLVQTGSAASYSTRFFHLATQLGWNDEALRARYYDGLKENVKDALAYADRDSRAPRHHVPRRTRHSPRQPPLRAARPFSPRSPHHHHPRQPHWHQHLQLPPT